MTTCPATCPHGPPAREACHLDAGHPGPHELRTEHRPGITPLTYCMWTETT